MTHPDMIDWKDFLAYGWMVFLLFFGIQRKTNLVLHGRISEVRTSVAENELETVKMYVTKQDHKDFCIDILKEIRAGFDKLERKLDQKVDK